MKILRNILIFALSLIIVLYLATKLLEPKYTDIREGNMVSEYYSGEKDHQVLFVGDCELYENVSPVELWRQYGITSYIRGSAQQLIWQSYYLLEDTLKYETPKVVVFNVLSMKYNEPQKEAYNRMSIDGMPLSLAKIRDIEASKVAGEDTASYLFPLLRYHDRWKDLSWNDVKYLFSRPKVTINGFMMRNDVKPVDWIPDAQPLADYNFGPTAWEYLDKMRDLCKSKGIQLMLVKAPSLYPFWYAQWDQQIADYAKANGLIYKNMLVSKAPGDMTPAQALPEIGLDYSADTYDGGLHLNCAGAEKLSDYLGKILQTSYFLPDLRSDSKEAAIWKPKVAAYDKWKQLQLQEIADTGKVQTFFVPG